MIADPTIAHSVLEYTVLALLGGGGVFKAVEFRRSRNGTDKLTAKFKEHLKDAHKPLLKELTDLCEITREMSKELHTYIEIQKDRDRRGRV